MSENPESRGPDWTEVLVRYRWPLTFLGVLLVLSLAAYLVYRETLAQAERVAGAAGKAAAAVEEIARGFLTGDVTETFVASIPEIHSTGAGNLELAVAEVTETLRRSDERRVLWDFVSLGTNISEIRVPVTYRYHLRLADPWRIVIDDHVCTVYAPPIRASLPPAIDTRRMEKHVEEGWLRFDGAEQMTVLEKSITPQLVRRAQDERHIDWVREEARKTVAEFVRSWLIYAEQWDEERVRAVRVIFPDETEAEPERQEWTVTLEDAG